MKTVRSPFLFLALDLPRPPLFQDSVEKNIIPQVALSTILAKYDGSTTQARRFLLSVCQPDKTAPHATTLTFCFPLDSSQEFGDQLKRHKLNRLPPYLILHTKRFTKNNFVEEKNPTIVNFPLRGVDMAPCSY